MKRRMTPLAERLRRARHEAGFATAAEAARAHGWNLPTYNSHENGYRGFNIQKAKRYARAFRVRFGWLIDGAPPMRDGEETKIVGAVGAGAEVVPADEESDIGEFGTPPGATAGALTAVLVKGDSMYPWLRDGDAVLYGDKTSYPHGRECVVKLKDGRAFIKQVERGRPGRFNLISYNAPPILDAEIEWAAPVLWIRRRNS